jgi:hypothetical protein
MHSHIFLLFCIISAYITIFFIGFLFGKNFYSHTNIINNTIEKKHLNKKHNDLINKISKVSIDDSKLVSNIDTTEMEKKYDNIAPSVEINDNIDSSVNKLSSLIKGK